VHDITQAYDTETAVIEVRPPAAFTGGTIDTGFANQPYSYQLQATGGSGNYSWTSADLPNWLTLDPDTGALSGQAVPDSAGGSATFNVTLTDNATVATTTTESVTIPIQGFGIEPPGELVGYVESPFDFGFTAENGGQSQTWSVDPSTPLPSWLTLNPDTGELSTKGQSGEVPLSARGTYTTVTVDALDHPGGATASVSVTIFVSPWASTELGYADDQPPTGINAISCPPADSAADSECIVAGGAGKYPMVGSGSDLDFSIRTLPVAAGLTGSGLDALSCPSEQFCLAAGGGGDVQGNGYQVFSTWNGSTWSAPAKSVAGNITSVSCADPGWCMVLGIADSSGPPLSEIWTPGGLTVEPLPSLGTDNQDQVSCPSENYCLAQIGNHVLAWDGSSWKTLALPSGQDTVSGVSCGAVGHCQVLAGSGGDTNEADDVAGETLQPTPLPGVGSNGVVTAVSCSTQAFCIALGYGDGVRTWLWNGTSWSAEKGDTAPFDSSVLSCSSSFDCLAAQYSGDPGNYEPLIESYQTG
jgi:hypothetical protein